MTWSPWQKTEELRDGCARDAWERIMSEYDLTEGEDKITLLSMFQQNQLEDVRTNITVWLTLSYTLSFPLYISLDLPHSMEVPSYSS